MSNKIFYFLTAVVIAAVSTGLVLYNNSPVTEEGENSYGEKWEEKALEIQKAMEWQNLWRSNEVTGEVEMSDYNAAIKAANELAIKNNQRAGQTSSMVWEFVGPDNVGGRTRAILVDKDNSNLVLAGGVGGGMYKSTDAGANWEKINVPEDLYLTNISCISQASNGDIYVGTGEGHSNALSNDDGLSSGSVGNGVYKSTDRGNTWTHLTSTGVGLQGNVTVNEAWYAVNGIACDPTNSNRILAATWRGMYESEDAGLTWNLVVDSRNNNSTQAQDCDDVVITTDGVVFFACNNDIHKMNPVMDTFRNLSTSGMVQGRPNPSGRMELAIAPSDPNYIYVLAAFSFANRFCLDGVYQSKDQGWTWTTIGPPVGDFEPFAQLNQTSEVPCQGWYDNTIGISPTDPEKVYVGGVTFWTYDQGNWNLADNIRENEEHPHYIHADKHAIVFDPKDANVMYVGHDGGVAKSTNAVSSYPYPTYKTINKGYGVTQFYAIAASIYGQVFGGTQDNSSPFVDLKGNTKQAAKVLIGGDGGYCEISKIDPSIMFGESQNGTLRRSGNGGASFSSVLDSNIDPDGTGEPSGACGALFITPFWLAETFEHFGNNETVDFTADRDYAANETIMIPSALGDHLFEYTSPTPVLKDDVLTVTDPLDAKLYMTTRCGVWILPEPLNLAETPEWFRLNVLPSGRYPVALATTKDANTMYIAYTNFSNTTLYRVDGIASAEFDVNSSNWDGAADGITFQNLGSFNLIRGIDVDDNDEDHIVICLAQFGSSTRVFESFDAGQTWLPIQGDLPLMPCYDVVIVDDPAGGTSNTFIVGSELGAWITEDGGSTWQEANNGGLLRGPVFRLRKEPLYPDEQEGCKVIYAGTHGQGAFRTVSFTKSGCDTEAGKLPELSIRDLSPNEDVFNFTVYPNPISEGTNGKVDITLDNNADVIVNIIDMPGRIVKQYNYNDLAKGDHTLDFDVAGLSKGNYMMTLRTAGSSLFNKRIIVVQ